MFTNSLQHALQEVLYHFVTTVVVMICAFAYLVMIAVANGWYGNGDGAVLWVHYADWLVSKLLQAHSAQEHARTRHHSGSNLTHVVQITTPMLLVDLGRT